MNTSPQKCKLKASYNKPISITCKPGLCDLDINPTIKACTQCGEGFATDK